MPHTIAIVEDEPTIARSVAARLRSEGFEVEVAHDGYDGGDLVRCLQPTPREPTPIRSLHRRVMVFQAELPLRQA